MAVSQVIADQIFRWALGQIRGQLAHRGGLAGEGIDEKALRSGAWRNFSRKPDGTFYTGSETSSVVNKAVASYLAGHAQSGLTATAVPRSSIPVDPTIRDTDPGYLYRIVVKASDDQGNSIETLILVTSDRPLSTDELYAEAQTGIWEGTVRSGPPSATRGEYRVQDLIVISVGRRA